MRTLRSLVIVTVRQPPRPVPLYFADFASKPAWYAPFRVLPLSLSRKFGTILMVRAQHLTVEMWALARQQSSQVEVPTRVIRTRSIRAFTRAVLTTVQCNPTVVSSCKSKEGTGFQNGQGENCGRRPCVS